MLDIQQVLRVVQEKGPIIANKIKQILEQPDANLINVYLSQLKAEERIKLTHVQLGSSSFAYVAEQKKKLARLIDHLNEKERRVAYQLKKKGIMRANKVDPLTRVCLTQIKDFAVPIRVKTSEGEEIFYRYFLLKSQDAQFKIKKLLGKLPKKSKKPSHTSVPAPKQKQLPTQPTKKKIVKPKEQKTLAPVQTSEFGQLLKNYFSHNNIQVEEFSEVRKNSEIDCVIRVPSSLATITFFCKAKSKKNSNDGDLAGAILSAKRRMLPVMYFTTGKVTKKAKENPELQEITVIEHGNTN